MGMLMFVVTVSMVLVRSVLGFGHRKRGVTRHILFSPVLLPGHILFAINPDVHLGSEDPAAGYARNFELCAYSECRNRVLQQRRRHSGVDKRAEEHIAADTGEALEISDAHS